MESSAFGRLATIAAALVAAGVVGSARAATFSFALAGPGVSGSVTLTYGPATDARYAAAFEITGASGSFSDLAVGIQSAAVVALVPIARAAPEAGNLLAPNDFSRYAVATGLQNGPAISYDNLYYPAGSPQTATDYPGRGGFLDIYGVLFDIGGGRAVNVWSNGNFGSGPIDYGVAVVTPAAALDYVEGGVLVAAVPEPGSGVMLGAGLVAVAAIRRRARRDARADARRAT